MSIRISVIIPVYNAGNYIGRTISNLKQQTFDDFEVLLVDNASTDDSRAVMEQAAGDDARFHLLSEQEQGPAAARNRGLKEASGSWILFLDADDAFTTDMLERLWEPVAGDDAEKNLVMVVSGYQTYREGKLLYESPPVTQTFIPEDMMARLFQVDHYQGFIWNKLLRRDIIEQGRLRFRENIFYNEDRLFVENYLGKCYSKRIAGDVVRPEIQMIPARSYHYQLREDSAMSVARDETGVTVREVSEIAAFDCMLRDINATVGADSRAFSLALQDMVFSELRLFRRMIDNENIFRYRNHPMRMYARAARRMKVTLEKDRDKILWKIFLRYGRTGITYTKNPQFFLEER